MPAKKRRLGRGLDALLGPEPKATAASKKAAASASASASKSPEAAATTEGIQQLPVDRLKRGRYQPRASFPPEAISELAKSIKSQGIMQPIVARPAPAAGKKYEIIAGERRWRAAQQAGLQKVPVIVREVEDEDVLVLSLIENIQREDLNPLEEAKALHRLTEEFGLTHQQVSKAVGKSRSAVTNLLRLTQLAAPVAKLLANGDLEMGHARALLALEAAVQPGTARQVVKEGLNVRQTEELVRRLAKSPQKKKAAANTKRADADTRRLESNLAQQLGQPVQVRHTSKGKGRLVISYSSLDELDGLLGRLGYSEQ